MAPFAAIADNEVTPNILVILADDLIDRYLTRPAVEFYDMKIDPDELYNLANEPKHQRRIAKMRIELEAWMEQQGDTGAAMYVPF